MNVKKIGVFAGVFDPMHSGHLDFISQSIKKYKLDKVLILIEEKSKFKQALADFTHRKKIVELSVKNMPAAELYEPLSASFPLSSTLPKIKKDYDCKIYLLIGDDVKRHIAGWPDFEDIAGDAELVVADRNGSDKYRRVSSKKVKEQIKSGAGEADMSKDALDYCRRNGLYG